MATSTIKQVTNNSGDNYCKMPDGTLIQWGAFSSTLEVAANAFGEDTITFPMSFKTYNYMTFFSVQSGAPAQRQVGLKDRAANAMDVYMQNLFSSVWSHPYIFWLAIGRWK